MRTRAWDVAVLVFDEVDLLDVTGVLHVLSETGRHYNFRPYRAALVSETGHPVLTRAQTKLIPDKALALATAPEIVVIPGGYGARRLLENPAVVAWLTLHLPKAEWVLAVGEGVLPLAKAFPLGNAQIAASPNVAPLLLDLAPEVQIDSAASVSFTRNLGFAKLSAHSLDLALELVALTLGANFAQRTAWAIGHRWAPLQADVVRADAAAT